MSNNLNFQLRPSLAKWILRILILGCLGIFMANALHFLWIGLLMISVVMFSYIKRDKNPVRGFIHLDKEIWTIYDQQQKLQQVKIQHFVNYGYFIFIQFYDDLTGEKQYICVARDQLDFRQWKQLKKFIKLT